MIIKTPKKKKVKLGYEPQFRPLLMERGINPEKDFHNAKARVIKMECEICGKITYDDLQMHQWNFMDEIEIRRQCAGCPNVMRVKLRDFSKQYNYRSNISYE